MIQPPQNRLPKKRLGASKPAAASSSACAASERGGSTSPVMRLNRASPSSAAP